jgi:hypothetical protein
MYRRLPAMLKFIFLRCHLFNDEINTDQQLGEQYLEFYGPTMQLRNVNGVNTLWPTVAPQHQNHIHISLP